MTAGRNSRLIFSFVAASLVVSASFVQAEGIKAKIYKKGLRAPLVGEARYLKSSKVYKIKKGSSQLTVKAANVVRVIAEKPKSMNKAIGLVKAKRYKEAIPVLEYIVKKYNMFQWDVVATRWLAEAYLGTDNIAKASSAVDKLARANKSALRDGSFFKVYCTILMETNEQEKLDKAIDDQISRGSSRESVAVAQMMRGDVHMKKGNYREALLDGYLRTVIFYGKIKEIQPEALYKAMECFNKLEETGKAEKMRKQLEKKFPGNSYTIKASSSSTQS